MVKTRIFISTIAVAAIGVFSLVFFANRSSAVTASDWRAGNIVDDFVFTNSDDMTVADIQAFLNSVNPNCDTYGTGRAVEKGRGDITRAQYAASRGWAGPPYVCLKDYYEVPKYSPGNYIPANNFSGSIPAGAVSAAQIIYDAAKRNNLSPKVILVKIATESAGPLTTDNWPLQSQYTYAMGSHCPDSGPGGSANCDRNYAGFSMQVESGAQLMRWYLDNMDKPWWTYKKPFATNSILWNVVQRGCGAGDVYIASKATAALYTYTPYQPNQAALNNMYGLGDHCSAYGNRNFWRVWNDWFGSTQYSRPIISFKSHISYYGWTGLVHNRGITGFTGQSKSMQAFTIDGEVTYSSYSEERGWQPTVYGSMQSGTTDLSRPIQAVKIQPTGSLAEKYDLYYRAHVSYVGWMGWAKNGEPAGITGGPGNNIEALEIRLVHKGSSAPEDSGQAFKNISTKVDSSPLAVSISSHVGMVGWQPAVTDEMISGTTGQSRRIEAVKASLINKTGISGNLRYSSHVSWVGWQDWKNANEISGTTGQFKSVEAIRFMLTSDLAKSYDIWYRAYSQYVGWMGWAKNGEPAGSTGATRQLEAIQIRIAPKNSIALPSGAFYNPANTPVPDLYDLNYATHVSYVGWMPNVSQGVMSGTTGRSFAVEALRITKAISQRDGSTIAIRCSSKSANDPWAADIPVTEQQICGTTGQTKALNGIKLSLSETDAKKYDIYYQTHLSWIGWQEWKKNGEVAGDKPGSHIEAVRIKLVEK